MLANSNRYQDFKVVKRVALDRFIIEVQDSLDHLESTIAQGLKENTALNQEVSKLNSTIETKDASISSLEGQRDNIESAGMNVDKNTFSTAMWIAVLVLLGLLVAMFLRARAISSSQQTLKANLRNLEEDLSGTKKKALEREQELKREVQDYINKIEAMGPPRWALTPEGP